MREANGNTVREVLSGGTMRVSRETDGAEAEEACERQGRREREKMEREVRRERGPENGGEGRKS